MNLLLRYIDGPYVEDCDLSLRIGDFDFHGFRLTPDKGRWSFTTNDTVSLNGADITYGVINVGNTYIVDKKLHRALVVLEAYPDNPVGYAPFDRIRIGRTDDNDIIIHDSKVSSHHCEIYKENGAWYVKDLKSTNGTLASNHFITCQRIADDDIIVVGTTKFKAGEEFVVLNPGDNIRIKLSEADNSEDIADMPKRPVHTRAPRLIAGEEKKSFTIQAPPSIGSRPEINWLSLLLSPAIMIIASLALTTISPFFMLMSLVGVATAVVNYIFQKKKFNKQKKLQLVKYREYLDSEKEQIIDAVNQKSDKMRYINPDLRQCLKISEERNNRLWERRIFDDDFMCLKVGNGTLPSDIAVSKPEVKLTFDIDPLLEEAAKISEHGAYLENVPIICDVRRSGIVGVIGKRSLTSVIIKNMIAEAVTLHSYDELKLSLFYSSERAKEWSWMRWLPHIFTDDFSMRMMACETSDVFSVTSVLKDVFQNRKQDLSESRLQNYIPSPYYMVIIDDPVNIGKTDLIYEMLKYPPELQTGIIFIGDDLLAIPKECTTIIDMNGQSASIFNKQSSDSKQPFVPEKPEPDFYDRLARSLSPIRVNTPLTKNGRLPDTISFIEGITDLGESLSDIGKYWEKGKPHITMAVPIGIGEDGNHFYFDINEKAHGPHGMVAGTTGSGKTEAIQTWILSMAMHFSPEDVSFVLIDFKGTGLLQPFIDLPHLAGSISNLDKNIVRDLISLKSEMSRREALFASCGVNDIIKYKTKYDAGLVSENLSFLIIVIDEFAEFKQQYPDFMSVIDSLFTIGRALGIYIILLAQKPALVVGEQVRSNTKFRWCLKVASSADSKEMLDRTDAARITLPGRMFIKVGDDQVFTQIQSYYSGAPYTGDYSQTKAADEGIYEVDILGRKNGIKKEVRKKNKGSLSSETEVVVKALRKYVSSNNIGTAKRIWTEKLPDKLFLDDLKQGQYELPDRILAPAVGLADDPLKQVKFPLRIDFEKDGHVAVIGASGTGKTTFLHTLIMSVCSDCSPEDVNIYIIDFGGLSMNVFRNMPHIGGIAGMDDEERIGSISNIITQQIEQRKVIFSNVGVNSIGQYHRASEQKLPYILLILDNYDAVAQVMPNLAGLFFKVMQSGRNYGVFAVVSALGQLSLGYKLSQNISRFISLRLNDKSEYTALVGKTGGLEPEDTPGRGLVRLEYPVEFQTALPMTGDNEAVISANIRNYSSEMAKKWSHIKVESVKTMPETVTFDDVQTDSIGIGLSFNDIKPVTLGTDKTHCVLISADTSASKNNMCTVIGKQLREKIHSKVIVFDAAGDEAEALRNYSDVYITEAQRFDSFLEELKNELSRRSSSENHDFTPLSIIISDLKSCFDSISNESVQRLAMVVKKAAGLGVYLIVGGLRDEIGALYSVEMFTISLVRNAQCIILGGKATEHVIECELTYSEKNAPLDPDEGFLVINKKAEKFKSITIRSDD